MIPTDSGEMSKSDGDLVWRSGDWVDPPNKRPPYNGIEIIANPLYDPETHKLTALPLQVRDFSLAQDGAKREEEFHQLRDRAKVTLPKPTGDFTVAGYLELLMSQRLPDSLLLLVNLRYGLPHERHHVDGGILEIPLTNAAEQ